MKITKVYLKEFIETLIFAYNKGADFADIIMGEGEEDNTITIAVEEEYMNNGDEESSQIDETLLRKLMN
jgi:hypothetical protein